MLRAQAAAKTGPAEEKFLPGSFHSLNINGKHGLLRNEKKELERDGRYHSLVLEYGLKPVVLIFAHDPKATQDEELLKLLKKVDEAIDKDHESSLRSFVVFLSPHAQSSVTEANLAEDKRTTDPKKLVDETVQREEMIERLEKVAAPFKNVIVSCYPDSGPKAYNLSDKADITVILYFKYKVKATFTFNKDQPLTAERAEQVMQAVWQLIGRKAPPVEEKAAN
jgi:hypothetical protein